MPARFRVEAGDSTPGTCGGGREKRKPQAGVFHQDCPGALDQRCLRQFRLQSLRVAFPAMQLRKIAKAVAAGKTPPHYCGELAGQRL